MMMGIWKLTLYGEIRKKMMDRYKGFLTDKDNPDRDPVMTATQQLMVLKGAEAAFFSHCPPKVAKALTEALRAAMWDIPESRSCECCDFFEKGHCSQWTRDVPSNAIATGCDSFQDFGVPF